MFIFGLFKNIGNGDLMMDHDKILILDFGSQYNQLIARRVRENNVYCELKPYYSVEK